MNQYDLRKTPAADLTKADSKQWPFKNNKPSNTYKLYFYMLSRSVVEWHPINGGAPYYYLQDSRKYFTRTDAAKEIGCTTRTINTCLDKLIEMGLMRYDKKWQSFIFDELEYWTPIDWKILKLFMILGADASWDIMIRFYSVLLYAQARGVTSFTMTNIIQTLGIRNDNAPFLKMCLDWWQAIGLIDYRCQKVCHPCFGEYFIYTVQRLEYQATKAVDNYMLSEHSAPALQAWNLLQE